MKIKVLIDDKINKTYNVLKRVQKFDVLNQHELTFDLYNNKNWDEVFSKTIADVRAKKFERVVVFDDCGLLPFMLFSKEMGFIASCPVTTLGAHLSVAHNNANVLILTCDKMQPIEIKNIIRAYFVSEYEGGRHETRIRIMQKPFVESTKTYKFSTKKADAKTILLTSDHAGFAFKDRIGTWLKEKGYKVIDIGTDTMDSTHYSMFAIATVLEAYRASCAIAFCGTGAGMANTLNNFRGIHSVIGRTPKQVARARSVYGCNALAIGARFINLKDCQKLIETFLATPCKLAKEYKNLLKHGWDFDEEMFKKIVIEKNIKIPKELR